MSKKILILYDNKVDQGTVSTSSEAGDLIAANLQDRRISKVARTQGLADEYWQVDFGERVPVSVVAVVRFALPPSGFWLDAPFPPTEPGQSYIFFGVDEL